MKRYFLCFFLGLMLVGFVSVIFRRPENKFLSSSLWAAHPGVKKNRKGQKEYIPREFIWKNSKGKQIKTLIYIPKKTLKKEMRNFGIVFDIVHPLYIKKQGFRKIGNLYMVNYKKVYERNLKNLEKISVQLSNSAGIKKNMDPLKDFLKFTQQIHYKKPPKYFKGKFICEFFTPLHCLYEKYGDCDTKSILLAGCLGALPGSKEKFILLILKGYGVFHAILAVKRKPLPGMVKLFYHNKGYYIPLETTAPGWLPGFVGRHTINSLKAGLFIYEDLN